MVTVAYFSENFTEKLIVNQTESLGFEFFYPNNFPKHIAKHHQTILNDFLKNHYSNG